MKTLLERAKALLIDAANDLYDMRKDELDFDALSYRNHFSNLGELIFQIENMTFSLGTTRLMLFKKIIFRCIYN
jgi:hypothetical protein